MNEKTKEKLQLIIFISIFLVIYFLLNYFVLTNIARFFDLEKNILFYLLLIILTLSFIFASMLESNYGNKLTRIVYFLASYWMGLLFIMFWLLLFFKIIEVFLDLPKMSSGIVLIIITIILSIIGMVNAIMIKVSKISIYTTKINSGLRIVQLSDLHMGPVRSKIFLEKAIGYTNKLRPDYVFITGDLVDGRYKYPEDYFKSLNNIKAKTYFVIGNHETYAGTERITDSLENINISILRNTDTIINELQIIGIDDSEDKKQVETQLSSIKIDKSKYSVLLYHRPDGFKQAVVHNIDLMLSGHTHAGQIFPFNILTYWANGFNQGLYKMNSSTLYVSSGIGTWGPPMRLGTRSEIVLIRLLPSK